MSSTALLFVQYSHFGGQASAWSAHGMLWYVQESRGHTLVTLAGLCRVIIGSTTEQGSYLWLPVRGPDVVASLEVQMPCCVGHCTSISV